MEFSRSDLDYGLRTLGIAESQVTVTDDRLTLTFEDYVDVYRFWLGVAQLDSHTVNVNELLDGVATNESDSGAIVLEFNNVRVSSPNGTRPTTADVASAGADSALDRRVTAIEEAVQRLTDLAARHLGSRV